jgi:hypothetical protein
LAEGFSERSQGSSLKTYLIESGARCAAASTRVACEYEKAEILTPRIWGSQASPRRELRFVLKVSFPAADRDLTPEQIDVDLKRFDRLADDSDG